MPRVISRELSAVARIVADEVAGTIQLGKYFGWVGLQEGAMRVQDAARRLADLTRPARFALADRLDRLAARVGQTQAKPRGALFSGGPLANRFLVYLGDLRPDDPALSLLLRGKEVFRA
ncbi:MAG: hypothetical protein HYT76_02125 [Deltaproteobacteria bacterium]|nr:hypothetical protein [Deltaproteobacteria bacterium]